MSQTSINVILIFIKKSMFKMKFLVVLMLCVRHALGVIYNLNETEYDRLPPLFHLDPFHPCLRAPGDTYCHVDASLVASGASELLALIEEYSAATITHYNHSLIHWGICVTKTCRNHLGKSSDLNTAIEACLNQTLTKSHQLQTRLVQDKVYCSKYGDSIIIDTGDVIVAVAFVTILLLNIFGSCYDFCYSPKSSFAGRFLLCFSVKRNWRRLVAPSGEGPEPKLRRLKFFNGVKALTTFFVILGHSPLTALITTNNPQFVESTYYDFTYHVYYNGNVIVQSFFMMSGFFLAYNILILEEKRRMDWKMVPKGVMLRWLRLTPVYAATLAFIATWLRHLGNGPLWKPVVGVEVEACRRDWFYNLLYVNNYIDHSHCMAQTWYLAADMQLSVIGLLIFCVLPTARARRLAITAMCLIGLVTPALQVYMQNLHAKYLLTPEVARQYFVNDPTFNHLYKRTHTNLICYAMGLALGLWIYNLQDQNIDVQKYKKYRWLFWASIPLGFIIMMSGAVFFMEALHIPLAVRLMYASAHNPAFILMAFILTPGIVFKLENVYRGILEWRGWSAVGRVSYCAYQVHAAVVRTSTANHTSLTHTSFYLIYLNYFGILVITFIIAVPCWMLVEAPFGQLIKLFQLPGPKEEEKVQVSIIGGKKDTSIVMNGETIISRKD